LARCLILSGEREDGEKMKERGGGGSRRVQYQVFPPFIRGGGKKEEGPIKPHSIWGEKKERGGQQGKFGEGIAQPMPASSRKKEEKKIQRQGKEG